MEEKDKKQEFSFIKEKIKEKPMDKRRMGFQLLWIVVCAFVFGTVSSLTFALLKPGFEEVAKLQADTTVTIPKDEETEQGENKGHVHTDEAVSGDAASSEGVGSFREQFETAHFQEMQTKLYSIGKKGNCSVVTVTGFTSHKDWFDSSYENEQQASGIIVANNGMELLILTEKKVIANAKNISITFMNGDVVSARLKKYDGNTGIAIISADLDDISKETMKEIKVATLGNSLKTSQGSVVIAIGSPAGATYSILCGTITSSGKTISTWDSTYTLFTTDIIGSKQGSGVLINLQGEVVGIIMQDYDNEGEQNVITALSVSQLKDIIEDLLNGRAIPYLGLMVTTVTDEIAKEYGLPKGVYIKNVETDLSSPAMNAGLQEADIITKIDGKEIMTVEEYTQTLLSLEPEQQVNLTVLRQNGMEYVELNYTATVGVLQ